MYLFKKKKNEMKLIDNNICICFYSNLSYATGTYRKAKLKETKVLLI